MSGADQHQESIDDIMERKFVARPSRISDKSLMGVEPEYHHLGGVMVLSRAAVEVTDGDGVELSFVFWSAKGGGLIQSGAMVYDPHEGNYPGPHSEADHVIPLSVDVDADDLRDIAIRLTRLILIDRDENHS